MPDMIKNYLSASNEVKEIVVLLLTDKDFQKKATPIINEWKGSREELLKGLMDLIC